MRLSFGRRKPALAIVGVGLPLFVFAATRAELVKDGEFENRQTPWQIPEGGCYSFQEGAGRNGTRALAYENHNPQTEYRLPRQFIKARPGAVYCYSGWIRAEDLKVSEPGFAAQVCVEWQDASGRMIGGDYAPGLRNGTTPDWVKVQWVTPPLPANAATVTVTPYAQRGATGKVWFDDVSVVEYGRDPVEGIFSSAYRNTAHAGTVDFRAVLAVPEKYRLADLKAEFIRKNAAGEKLREAVKLDSREVAHYRCEVADLPFGTSGVGFELRTGSGEVLGRSALIFNRPQTPQRRKVEFDRLGRTLVDGEPFFPLGMFISSKEGRDEYAAGPFNCVMSYLRQSPEDMDWWQAHGQKVIYCIKDIFCGTGRCPGRIRTEQDEVDFIKEKVAEVGSHPALLAWYTNDEFPVSYLPRMIERRKLMEKLDPEHPTWAVQYQIDQMRDYFPTFEVIGTDPYPVPDKPLSLAAEWTRKTREAYFGMRPLWQVPQAFDWAAYRSGRPGDRMPTRSEMRSMTWQTIAEGANGLIYYSFTGLRKEGLTTPFAEAWKDVVAVAAEVRKHLPILLAGGTAPAVEGAPAKWSVRTWRDGDNAWLLAVNAQAVAAKAELKISQPFGQVYVEFGPQPLKSGNGKVTVQLQPFEPVLLRLEVPPAKPAPRYQRRAEILWTKPICEEPGKYIGWPSVCRLRNGEIIAVFSGDREDHVCPYGKVQLVRSVDEGQTWSKPMTIADGPVDDRDAGIVEMPDGRLVVTYFTSVAYLDPSILKSHPEYAAQGTDYPPAAVGYFRLVSADGGQTWSEPERMEKVSHAPHGPSLLKDGSLLQLGRSFGLNDDAARGGLSEGNHTVISAWRSTDAGASWQCLCPEIADMNGENAAPNRFHEPNAVELDDGTLVGLVRYHGPDRCLRSTRSTDGGRTWSPMAKTELNGYPAQLLKLPGGRLVAVYGRRWEEGGYGEFAAISEDGGQTWDVRNEISLAPCHNGDLGYPASCQLGDGSILTVYYQPKAPGLKPCLMATCWKAR